MISNHSRIRDPQNKNVFQAMKESFAQERGECLDRMDRRALRERIAIERQQVPKSSCSCSCWLYIKTSHCPG